MKFDLFDYFKILKLEINKIGRKFFFQKNRVIKVSVNKKFDEKKMSKQKKIYWDRKYVQISQGRTLLFVQITYRY